jgi:hypothetical protein
VDKILTFLDDIASQYPGAADEIDALRNAIDAESANAEDELEADDSELPPAEDEEPAEDDMQFPDFPMRKPAK